MFLAFKEIRKSKLRYTLISVITIAVLFLVFFVTGLANGLAFGDSSSIKNIQADYIVMNKEADGAIIKSDLTPKDVEIISKQLGENATPLAITMSALERNQEKDVDVVYFSVDSDRYRDLNVIEGKDISELSVNEVIADKSIEIFGLKLNDQIIDKNTGKKLTIAGITKDQTYSMMPVVYADFELGMNSLYQNKLSYNAVVYTGEKASITGYDTMTPHDTAKSIPGYKETQGSLMMIVVFLFIISAFVSTVFFYVITLQKINQFGILKAIGAKTSYITKSIIIQVTLITMIGLVFSSLLVYGMTQVIPEGMPFRTSPTLVLGTAVLFLVLNLLGSLLSVNKVAKIDALEAIGRIE
ncbi:ABC transporter permease [Paenibacillus sp. FA6]|uniref:ABC transporter permease n=1 Tax=Paenibacillus sp. FA6 TaxID=3413029 RepID=UPI003F65798E